MPHNLNQQPEQPLELLGNGNFAKVYASPDGQEVYKHVYQLLVSGEEVENFDKDQFFACVGGDLHALYAHGLGEFIPETHIEWQEGQGVIVQEKVFDMVSVLGWGKQGPAIAGRLGRLLAAAFTMGTKTFNGDSHQLQMPDMHDGNGFMNVVVGRTANDPTLRVYLIDTYPVTIPEDRVPDQAMWSQVINTLASRWPKEYKEARRAMSDFYRHIREASAIHQSQRE